jgi:DNA-binding transcriptional ArsR family regulator
MLDREGRVLAFAALVRVFTLGQTARLLGEDVHETELLLGQLVWQKELLGEIEDVELPKGLGRGLATVYYLTPMGGRILEKMAPSLAGQARPGKPRGANRDRIPHELLVAEAYLWLNQRYQIYEFWPETELKRRIGRARALRAGRFIKGLPDEATGDFKALVITRGEREEEHWIHGEVVVRYKADEVDGKPDDVIWFAVDRLQADIIEYYRGEKAIMLGDVRAPIGGRIPRNIIRAALASDCRGVEGNDDSPLRRFQRRALEALSAVGGMATAEAVAFIMGAYRPHVSHALKRLEAAGRIRSEDAQLVPGRDVGRPMRLYICPGITVESVWEKIKALIRTRVITELTVHGYRFYRYDPEKDEVEFRHRTGAGERPLVVVIDEPREPTDRLAERMLSVARRCKMPLGAVQSKVRAASLRRLLGEKMEEVLVCNVVEGRKDKPRGVSDQQQKLAARAVSWPSGERTDEGWDEHA